MPASRLPSQLIVMVQASHLPSLSRQARRLHHNWKTGIGRGESRIAGRVKLTAKTSVAGGLHPSCSERVYDSMQRNLPQLAPRGYIIV